MSNYNFNDKKICIVGLGYVGLPLGSCFLQIKFKVIGFDISDDRIQELENGIR